MRDQTSDLDLISDERMTALERGVHARIAEQRRRSRVRHRLLAAGLAVALVGGGTTAGAIQAWQVNENGQSYGRGDLQIVDPSDGTVVEPDLIEAVGWNGDERVVGYVLSSDLSPEFANPDEVAAWLEEHPPTEDREIPLYDKDLNQIGVFILQGFDDATESPGGP